MCGLGGGQVLEHGNCTLANLCLAPALPAEPAAPAAVDSNTPVAPAGGPTAGQAAPAERSEGALSGPESGGGGGGGGRESVVERRSRRRASLAVAAVTTESASPAISPPPPAAAADFLASEAAPAVSAAAAEKRLRVLLSPAGILDRRARWAARRARQALAARNSARPGPGPS